MLKCFYFLSLTFFNLLLLVHSKDGGKTEKVKTKFTFGRIPPGSFEYSELNGFYSPKKAVTICEGDPACGGFTFKGTPNLSKRKYEIFFFHFVASDVFDDKSKVQYYYWTSYLVKNRQFSKLQNFKIRENSESANHGSCIQQRFNFFAFVFLYNFYSVYFFSYFNRYFFVIAVSF